MIADERMSVIAGAGARGRRVAFRLVDSVRGNTLQQLRSIESFYASDPLEQRRTIDQRVREVLRTARQAYRTVLGRTLPESDHLVDWPLLAKSDVKRLAHTALASGVRGGTIVTTSGSTGTPLQLPLTAIRAARRSADILYFTGWCGYRVGDPHAYIRISEGKSRLTAWLQNELHIPYERIDHAWLEGAIARLSERPLRVLIGYASALDQLARHAVKHGGSWFFDIGSVLTIAEPLTDDARKSIREAFGREPRSRYATQEVGVVAQECTHGQLHINTASIVVELLDPSDRVIEQPDQLGRVVLTDLMSHHVPLVRYELGDLARWGPDPCGCGRPGPTLASIEGRTIDVVQAVDGTMISGFRIHSAFRGARTIEEFRFHQLDEGTYRVLYKATGAGGDTQEEIASVKDELVGLLGRGAMIDLLEVEEIPRDPSGKRTYVRDLRKAS